MSESVGLMLIEVEVVAVGEAVDEDNTELSRSRSKHLFFEANVLLFLKNPFFFLGLDPLRLDIVNFVFSYQNESTSSSTAPLSFQSVRAAIVFFPNIKRLPTMKTIKTLPLLG